MKISLSLFFFICFQVCFPQKLEIKFLDSISLRTDHFIGVDEFESYYYLNQNTLYKKTSKDLYSYANTQLGNITSVDITNPLKIIIFYRDFNTVLFLDNRLNELADYLNLTSENFTKNVTFSGLSSNNNLWLFSSDNNSLTLWDYENDNIIFESQPLDFYGDPFEVIAFKSTYRNCWIISKNSVLKFNDFGSYIETIPVRKNEIIIPFNNDYLSLRNNELYYIANRKISKIENFNPAHSIQKLVINKNNLYFFDANTIFKYEVLKN